MLLFWEDRKAFTHFANRVCSPLHTNLNLGGGPGFVEWSWINLDGANGPYNSKPFEFTDNVRLPFRSRRLLNVYTSHFLEHLLEPVARRTLVETHRTMRKRGNLIVKIPDYDGVLAAWGQHNSDFFSDARWNFNAFTHTWAHHGVEDTLTNRALMIFCGYWNAAYGDHFSREINESDRAFHGPPNVPEAEAVRLFNEKKPSEIARQLHARVQSEDPNARFNHQTAWSRAEFIALLGQCGFKLLETDKAAICEKHATVPGLREMYDVTAYFSATKQ